MKTNLISKRVAIVLFPVGFMFCLLFIFDLARCVCEWLTLACERAFYALIAWAEKSPANHKPVSK